MNPIQAWPGVWLALARVDVIPDTHIHPAERSRAATLAPWRARQFLAARRLLRLLLGTMRPEAAEFEVVRGTRGRPELAGNSGLEISISHDEELVAVAVADGRSVGVDVQVPPDRVDDRLLRRCLRGHANHLTRWPDRRRAEELSWVWTAQEACVKASGTGLAGRPWAVDVPPGGVAGRWNGYRWISFRGRSEVPLSCAVGRSATD